MYSNGISRLKRLLHRYQNNYNAPLPYNVIYDGNCNLCVTLVQLLENIDQGQQFEYIPMQDLEKLNQFRITAQDCEMGMTCAVRF